MLTLYMSSLASINIAVLRHRPVQVSKSGYEQTSIIQLKFERKFNAPVKNITE